MIAFLVLTAPLGYFGLHALVRRLPGVGRAAPQKLVVGVGLLGASIEFALLVSYGGDSFDSLLFATVCSAGAAHAYFHLFNMSETARRVRLVVGRHLKLPPPEEREWGVSTQRRLERLRALGEVRSIGNRWSSIGGPLTRLARWLVAYERYLFPERKA